MYSRYVPGRDLAAAMAASGAGGSVDVTRVKLNHALSPLRLWPAGRGANSMGILDSKPIHYCGH